MPFDFDTDELPTVAHWIRVKDGAPVPNRRYLVCGGGRVRFAYRDETGQWRRECHRPIDPPSHYAPVPLPAAKAARAAGGKVPTRSPRRGPRLSTQPTETMR